MDSRLYHFCRAQRSWSPSCSFTVTVSVTLLAIAILLVFFLTALPIFDFSKYALNVGADPATGAAIELPGHGPFLPFGVHGILASLPFAVWLFLGIEQIPLAAEEAADPKRDMPKGIMRGMFTLIVLGFLVLLINPSMSIERQVTVNQDGPRRFRSRYLERTDPRWLPGDFWIKRREGVGVARRRRTDCEFPCDHLRLWQADLFFVAGRLFPLSYSSEAQDTEHCPHCRQVEHA